MKLDKFQLDQHSSQRGKLAMGGREGLDKIVAGQRSPSLEEGAKHQHNIEPASAGAWEDPGIIE